MLCSKDVAGPKAWHKYEDEIERLQKIIDQQPEEFRRLGQTAELLVAQYRHGESLKLFESAIELVDTARLESPEVYNPYHEHLLRAYAATLDFVGDIPAVEGIFHKLMDVYPHGQYLGEYAVFMHRRKRDFVKAEELYKSALQYWPDDSSIHLKYAGFLRHIRRDLEGAEAEYKLAINTNPKNPDAVGSYASYLHGVKRNVHMAEITYAKAVEIDPTHANNLCNFGLFLSEEKQDYAKAEVYYKGVLEVTPKHANTLYNYAVMLDSHCGRRDDAESLYERALAVEPRHAFALYNLAVLREEKVMIAEREEAEARDAPAPAAAESNNEKGETAGDGSGGGTLVSSKAVAKQKSMLQKTEAEKMARRSAVCELYARAFDADPQDATTAADYGRFLYARMDKREEAEIVLFKALALDDRHIVALYNLALAMHKKGRLEDAERLFSNLLTESPTHAAGTQQMGRMFVDRFKESNDQKHLETAMTCYERAFQLVKDPTTAVLEYLKFTSALAPNKLKIRAISFVEKYMKKFGPGSLGRESTIKQVLQGMGKIATRVAPVA
jgi:tetratricopeptide (TPR) repeat protein